MFFSSSFYFCISTMGMCGFFTNEGEKLALSVTFSGAEVITLIRDVNTDLVDKVWGRGLTRQDTIRTLTREKIKSEGSASSQLPWVKPHQNTADRTDAFSSGR